MKEFLKKHIYKIVIIFLIAVFVVGFIWGLNSVLKMEGVLLPSVLMPGKSPVPQNAAQAVEYLNAVVEKAVAEKPKTEFTDFFEIDGDSIKSEGEKSVCDTIVKIRESVDDELDKFNEDASVDFNGDVESVLKIPKLTANDIAEFKCEYIYYSCPSCGERSDEPHDSCELCGGVNKYLECYEDEYTITLTLKNEPERLKKNFKLRTADEALALAGDKFDGVLAVDSFDFKYSGAEIVFSVDRITDEITALKYQKKSAVASNFTFEGNYAPLGKGKTSFDISEHEEFTFTWPSLKLSEETLAIEPGATNNLLATLTCDDPTNKTVKWASSDESIATVDDEGYIKATKKTGKLTVTASFDFLGKTYTDSCEIWVKVPIESVDFNKGKLNLNVGESYALELEVSPKNATVKTAQWYSTDESIAVVDENGTVTALKTGEAKVYAVTDDGYFKTTCEVIVSGNA